MVQAERDFDDFGLPYNLQYLENISASQFKMKVKERAKIYFFQYLMNLKRSHSKMSKLNFDEFEMQPYLMREDISINMKKVYFSWCTRMSNFRENYRGGQGPSMCKLCNSHLDSQELSFRCPVIRSKINIDIYHEDIFDQERPDLPNCINIMHQIDEIRENT